MKVIYRAENAIDANLFKDRLDQAGIMAFVNGEFLQGGIGELPAVGLITVSVADSDVNQALPMAADFEKQMGERSGQGETRWDPNTHALDWQ